MRLVIGFSCLAIAAIASSPCDAAGAPTLCKDDELVVFSCVTGAHTASVCASKTISKTSGYMQYRFGQKANLDLAYPEMSAKPADIFTAGTMMFSGGGGAWLRFSKGPFQYTIFSATGKWGPKGSPADASGVAVQKDGKGFANFPCRSGSSGELGPDFFDKLKLETTDSADAFEIPEAFLPK